MFVLLKWDEELACVPNPHTTKALYKYELFYKEQERDSWISLLNIIPINQSIILDPIHKASKCIGLLSNSKIIISILQIKITSLKIISQENNLTFNKVFANAN